MKGYCYLDMMTPSFFHHKVRTRGIMTLGCRHGQNIGGKRRAESDDGLDLWREIPTAAPLNIFSVIQLGLKQGIPKCRTRAERAEF